jgi:phosphoinositide-3-kinase regulatory subunit 4
MGNNHTTLASIHATSTTTAAASTLGAAVAGGGGDDGSNSGAELPLAQEIIDAADPQLSSVFKIDKYLVPGSGRMMRTFRLKNKQNGSAVVVKVMWVVMATDSNSSVNNNSTGGNSSSASSMASKIPTSTTDGSDEGRVLIQTQQRELARIYAALIGKPHMAPFLYWKVGDAKSLPPPSRIQQMTMRPAVLIRPHFYTTLSDRLASRPFLTHVEKLWIVYQLLNALETMHGNVDVDTDRHDPIVHGFLTTENVGLSSWNWVVLTDISSYKARTALPDNDPSEYLYYFQELNQHRQGSDSTPREKRCYLAPERFYTPGDHHQEESSGHTTHRKKLDSKGDDGISKSTPRGYGEQQEGGDSLKSLSQNPAEFDSWKERRLTPAMDMFSAGCVIMETFLNGERAMDLGDLMEYRKLQSFPAILQQKLNKIEFSALRAACRHMLNLDPAERLAAGEYLDRLKGRDGVNTGRTELIPQSFEVISRLMSEVSSSGIHHGTDNVVITHDARIARAAAYYGKIVWETVGIHDQAGINYFCRALGKVSSVNSEDCDESGDKTAMGEAGEHGKESSKNCEEKKDNELDLFAETEALLAELGALSFDNDEVLAMESTHEKRQQSAGRNDVMAHCVSANRIGRAKRSRMSESSLLIYLQLVLSTIRHVQYPASKLVALQIIGRVASYSSDETRLQRIVPTTIALLHDQDPFCRASALQVLTSTISVVETFPPSDSKVFPQYIFKRIAHLITDPSLVVRLAFARSLAMLAETAHRFLDISHAVRLYEAIGGITSCPDSTDVSIQDCVTSAVFGDDVAKLLDGPTSSSDVFQRQGSQVMDSTTDGGKILMNSTYNSELGTLQETVSRWVVHITTDFSEHSSPVKRALLEEMTRLCNFFGLDGVMAFILPQLLSFLNDRKDWQLRVSLIDHIPSVGHYIGRAATEHFVLPCLETALVDNEEVVISRALKCLSQLLRLGLLSRGALLGTQDDDGTQESSPGLLKQYGPLLLHPSSDIRFHAIAMVNALCDEVGSLDAEVFVVPILRPFLRFQPSSDHLSHPDGLEKCLYEPWSWYRFNKELERTIVAFQSSFSPTAGEWTSIALEIKDSESLQRDEFGDRCKDAAQNRCLQQEESIIDEQTAIFQAYLHMLARRKNRTLKMVPTADFSHEGSLKLAQTVRHERFCRHIL